MKEKIFIAIKMYTILLFIDKSINLTVITIKNNLWTAPWGLYIQMPTAVPVVIITVSLQVQTFLGLRLHIYANL